MIYLTLLLSLNSNILDDKDIRKYSPEERENITIELIREENYDAALSFSPNLNLTGCIKILKNEVTEGIEDIKESAAKGNIFSLDLYLLFNLNVSEADLKKYIRNELTIYPDSTFSYESPYVRYLVFPPDSLYNHNIPTDSVLYPYILFKSGMLNMEKNPKETKKYFEMLIDKYPNSLPAIIARNTMRALEKIR